MTVVDTENNLPCDKNGNSPPCLGGYGVPTENSNDADVDAAPAKNTDNAALDSPKRLIATPKKATVGASALP